MPPDVRAITRDVKEEKADWVRIATQLTEL
jgi:hypothetical protein